MLVHPRLALVPLRSWVPFRDWATRGWGWLRLACCPVVRERDSEAPGGWERVGFARDPATLGLVSARTWGLVVDAGFRAHGAAAVPVGGAAGSRKRAPRTPWHRRR